MKHLLSCDQYKMVNVIVICLEDGHCLLAVVVLTDFGLIGQREEKEEKIKKCVVPENIHTPTMEGIGNSGGVGGSKAQENQRRGGGGNG